MTRRLVKSYQLYVKGTNFVPIELTPDEAEQDGPVEIHETVGGIITEYWEHDGQVYDIKELKEFLELPREIQVALKLMK